MVRGIVASRLVDGGWRAVDQLPAEPTLAAEAGKAGLAGAGAGGEAGLSTLTWRGAGAGDAGRFADAGEPGLDHAGAGGGAPHELSQLFPVWSPVGQMSGSRTVVGGATGATADTEAVAAVVGAGDTGDTDDRTEDTDAIVERGTEVTTGWDGEVRPWLAKRSCTSSTGRLGRSAWAEVKPAKPAPATRPPPRAAFQEILGIGGSFRSGLLRSIMRAVDDGGMGRT